MLVFVIIHLLSSSLADEDLKQILKSPKATLQLYRNLKEEEGRSYSGHEDAKRFRYFRTNAAYIARIERGQGETAIFKPNRFSLMSESEKEQYTGVNMTRIIKEQDPVSLQSHTLKSVTPPTKVLWTNKNAVTEVRQQYCRSCWAFAAVGALETRYKKLSGKLRKFSEQEFLDCTYEGKDGCSGGWPIDAYTYSKNNKGRLASADDYKNTKNTKARKCEASSKPNALVAMRIYGTSSVQKTETANIAELASGALAVCFKINKKFYSYASKIIQNECSKNFEFHTATAVGYTSEYVLVKNSWGSTWGEQGFVKFARNHHNCGLFEYSTYPILGATGKRDNNPSDDATSYRTDYDEEDGTPEPNPDCKDTYDGCYLHWCDFINEPGHGWIEKECAKTCNKC